jgi:hypothetical protein
MIGILPFGAFGVALAYLMSPRAAQIVINWTAATIALLLVGYLASETVGASLGMWAVALTALNWGLPLYHLVALAFGPLELLPLSFGPA